MNKVNKKVNMVNEIRIKFLKNIILLFCIIIGINQHIAVGKKIYPQIDKKIKLTISKTGLNRLSNPPYRIVQIVGDDNSYKVKSDENGANIYLMPLGSVGSKIEMSIKNNIGTVYDLELKVADVEGQIVEVVGNNKNIIDEESGKKGEKIKTLSAEEKIEIQEMLRSMRSEKDGKFYVVNVGQKDLHSDFEMESRKLYKWKNLNGTIIYFKNISAETKIIDINGFLKKIDNLVASYVEKRKLKPEEAARIFIIQKQDKVR